MADGLVVCDHDVEVVYISDAVSPLLDDPSDDAAEQVFSVLGEAVDGRKAERLLPAGGHIDHPVMVSGIPVVDEQGKSTGGIAVFTDNSDRGLSDRVLRDFVANVSHELKTPIGALGLLAETLLTEDDPKIAARLIQRLQLESMRVSQTVDDLLNLSRIEGSPKSVPSLLRVNDVLATAVSRVNYVAEHRQVRITITGNLDATLFGNHHDLVSALQHLLENGVKYSNSGSSVDVDITDDDGWTEICVTDHGPGISPQYLDRIFERFYRVDDARTRASGGTGLGLSLVKYVANSHGGDVTVTSEEGVGSTFKLRLAAGPARANINISVGER